MAAMRNGGELSITAHQHYLGGFCITIRDREKRSKGSMELGELNRLLADLARASRGGVGERAAVPLERRIAALESVEKRRLAACHCGVLRQDQGLTCQSINCVARAAKLLKAVEERKGMALNGRPKKKAKATR